MPEYLRRKDESDGKGKDPEGSEKVHGLLTEPADERDGQQVEKPIDETLEAKLRPSVLSLLVRHRLLGDSRESRPLGDQWNIPVHFPVHGDISHHDTLVGFQSAVEVVKLNAGELPRYIVKEL